MNYNDLPLEERIQKASEYALLLTEDERPDIDILSELQTTFSLDEEQAKAAYELMRSRFQGEYVQATNRKITKAWVGVVVCGLIAAFYLFTSEVYSWFSMFAALLFGLAATGAFTVLPKLYRQKKNAAEYFDQVDFDKKLAKKKQDDWMISLPLFFMCMSVVTSFMLIKAFRVVDIDNIRIVRNLEISERVKKYSNGGRHPSYYYLFHFRGYTGNFKLNETIYNYSDFAILDTSFWPGQKIDVQVTRDDAIDMYDKSKTFNVDLLNIRKYDYWLVDHVKRNAIVKKEDKRAVVIFGGLFFVSSIVSFFAIRYRKLRKRAVKGSAEEFLETYNKKTY